MKSYLNENGARLLLAVAIIGALALGVIDPAAAGVLMICDTVPTDLKALNEAMEKAFKAMGDQVKRVQDIATDAIEKVRVEGTLTKELNDKLTELGKNSGELGGTIKDLKDRILDVEQKMTRKPGNEDNQYKSAGSIVVGSDEFKFAQKNMQKPSMDPVNIGSFHKTAISGPASSATGTTNYLVQPDRIPGIIMPGLRRLTIRDLIPARRTNSNMVEFASENVYTDNAGPQYNASPGETEGATKNESGITFTLTQRAIVTLAHWIPASRQILADAPGLQSYVDGRLTYGLKLEEEDELLNSSGTNGELYGLNNGATAFTGGVTNQTALDTLLKAIVQCSLSEYDPDGIVLHPIDWRDIMLLKDTTGRYLFTDPQSVAAPRLWGRNVVATQSQTSGQFLVGAFSLAAEIVDREDASVRIAEQHADFFVRNMVAILAEERLALVIYRATAMIKGNVSFAG